MGQSGNIWMQAAAGAAGSAMGIGIQRLGANYDRRKQMQAQEELTEIQKRAEREMMDYQQQKALEMWEKTGYGAQMKQMKEAGLNPGLMYGMGGGGGQTTGPGGSPGITGGSAPYVDTAGMGLERGIQLALLTSQKEVLDSQADKNRADAEAKRGFETKESEARQESIWQGIDNMRNTHELQKLDMTMKNIENFEKQASQGDRLDYIEYQSKIAEKQMKIIANEQKISDSTLNDNIKKIKADAIGAVLRNELTKASTDKTKTATQLDIKQMNKITQEIMQAWDRIGQGSADVEIRKILMQYNTDPTRESMNQAVETIGDILKRR